MVKVAGRDLRVSPKHAREVCKAIKGMMTGNAKSYLEDVVAKKRSVPFRRYHGKVGHRSDIPGFYAGRYPVKTAKKIIELIKQAEANAEYRGLNIDGLKIIHAATQKGMKIKRYIPRAFGRSSPRFQQLTHVEIVVEEVAK